MSMSDEIKIFLGDATDVEARVYARYRPTAKSTPPIELTGTLRGPFCETARTLPADFEFRMVNAGDKGELLAGAIVTDPCMWTEEMPHVYQVDVEARRGEELVAEYHGKVGLRRLAPRRPVDFAPGTG
jgi:hypothetical protein